MENLITAVIPVRAGSRRIKNKNLSPFNNTTLLEHKIKTLQKVKEVDRIVVTSDSEYMLEIAQGYGVDIHKRAPEYCDEMSRTFGEMVRVLCTELEGQHIMWSTCTSPLVYPEIYRNAIYTYLQKINEGFDSLITVEMLKKFIWDDHGPMNYELGEKQVPSQQLPNLYVVTNGILLAPREKTIEWSYTYGRTPYKFMVDKFVSVDIDDEFDLLQAQKLLELYVDRFE